MNLKWRLAVMQFLQFYIWGAWLTTIGTYWLKTNNWSGTSFGAMFSTIGLASLFMPGIAGVIVDRFVNAERLLAVFHLCGAAILCYIPTVHEPDTLYWVMFLNNCFYMPTIALSITVSYSAMAAQKCDIIKEYPFVRVFGTLGFIAALWTVAGRLEATSGQFYLAAFASVVLGLYSFSLPACPPAQQGAGRSWVERMGLSGFRLLKDYNLALFFMFAMLLGAALQLTNAYGNAFLHDFSQNEAFKDTFAVRYPAFILSVSQISEVLFILAIPYFMQRFGIKKVMFMSMVAWVLRFALFAFGDPAGGLWLILLSCVIYGMAFDFFNISGSMFVETQVEPGMRASGQGLFMMMSNGLGAILGSRISGVLIDRYFTFDGTLYWYGIWLTFAAYAALVAVLFLLLFKNPRGQTLRA